MGSMKTARVTTLVLSILCGVSVSAEEPIKWADHATYFVDQVTCEGDGGSEAFDADWGGRHWTVVAPKAIDTSEAWEQQNGNGLHIEPSRTLREGIAADGGLVGDQGTSQVAHVPESASETRLLLVFVNHHEVPQDFSGNWRFVRVVMRLCEKRSGEWSSVRYQTTRAVVGKAEFWRTQSKTVRALDYSFDFERAAKSALTWARTAAGTPWVNGTLVVDPKALLWNPRRKVEEDLNAD
jgi:hypothetical protein